MTCKSIFEETKFAQVSRAAMREPKGELTFGENPLVDCGLLHLEVYLLTVLVRIG